MQLSLQGEALTNQNNLLLVLAISNNYTLSEETAHPTVYRHLNELWAVFIQLNCSPLGSQSAKKRPGSHKLIEEFLSCKPNFKFLKSNHN